MPNWQGLVSIYDEWIAVLFIFPAAERLRSSRPCNLTPQPVTLFCFAKIVTGCYAVDGGVMCLGRIRDEF
jgi:hypothetical protein